MTGAGPQAPGRTITRVVEGGLAAGKLRVGGVLLSVNGHDATTLDHQQCIEAIATPSGRLTLALFVRRKAVASLAS